MSPFHEIRELSRQQAAALARGDLDGAVELLSDRAALLATAPPAGPEDEAAIREVLRRDRDLAGAIRERMLDIRNRAIQAQQGRVALAGYHTKLGGSQLLLDTQR